MSGSHASAAFGEWSRRWICLATFTVARCEDVDDRIERVVKLWRDEIPLPWQRPADPRLLATRYGRTHHKHGVPKPGSEHEIEFEILGLDPHPIPSGQCFGQEIVDGVNAVPLARDAAGGRGGNVEADLLLLTASAGAHRAFLLEVKSTSNDAWYAVVENLRQLRLFIESTEARRIFQQRAAVKDLPKRLPMTAGVLAPRAFYTAPKKKLNATTYARKLIDAMAGVHSETPIELGVWEDGEIKRLEPE